MTTIATVVGARPQFVKASALGRIIASREADGLQERLIHTGQHYDANMSEVFFREMGLRPPDVRLQIGADLGASGHGAMTGRMLEALERTFQSMRPDWVVVFGDTNSTLAGALAASKLHLPLAHVEAGLRSFNRRMPEETNRVVADHVSDLLFVPTEAAVANLKAEGIPDDRICRCGDVMYDVILHYRRRAGDRADRLLTTHSLQRKGFVLATVHRAENTADADRLGGIMQGLASVARHMPVLCPLHPRTKASIEQLGVDVCSAGLHLVDPIGYLDMLALEGTAAVIATDSGGVQKEAYFNQVPCLTMRDETEWVELVEQGVNRLVGTDPEAIVAGFDWAMGTTVPEGSLYGDGRAASEIVERLVC